jgi:hypothetical protein
MSRTQSSSFPGGTPSDEYSPSGESDSIDDRFMQGTGKGDA